MIAYLKGHIIQTDTSKIILLVNQCMGYELFVINPQIELNSTQEFFVYHHQTAEQQSLFGFEQEKQKMLFLKLIGLSKIGPKTALNILRLGFDELLQAFANNDVKFLQKAKGLGKKNAERLILEFGNSALENILFAKSSAGEENMEVIYALKELGYRDRSIKDFLAKKPEHITDTASIIKYFLKTINN